MDGPDGALLSVGAFARRTGLSPKALRHYDRIGLFAPALVDSANYRWYGADQVETGQLIATLRAVDVPLDDVRTCLDGDPETISLVLKQHRRKLDARLTRLQRQMHRIAHLIDDGVDDGKEPRMAHTHAATSSLTDEQAREEGKELFNGTWELIENEHRTRDDDDRMLHMAHASRYHWGQVGGPPQLARGEWLCSRVYAVLQRPEPSLHHAQRVLDICQRDGVGDFDLVFGYEALARASAIGGDMDAARAYTEQALAAGENISEADDLELLRSDLETIPGQSRFW